MEVNNIRPQIIVHDGPTKGSYTVHLPNTDRPMTVSGPNFATVTRELSSLFPEYHFIYAKNPAYIYDVKTDRLTRDRDASEHALISNGIAMLEVACYEVRRELTLAEDEKRAPHYSELTAKIVSAFNIADKYFWIVEDRERKPKTPPAKSSFPGLRSPEWPKPSADYPKPSSDYNDDTDWTSKYRKDIIAKSLTKHTLPFGVGYSFDGDINDIEKLTKELEAIFKGFRR